MDKMSVLLLLFFPTVASKGSHSLWLLATYNKAQTPFPEFSYVLMLDDVRVLYYNGETKTFIRRGNTTNEDTVIDSNLIFTISDHIQASFLNKWAVATKSFNKTEGALTFQRLVLCELKENGEPGQMITQDAFQSSTTDDLRYVDKKFSYHVKPKVRLFQTDLSYGFRVSCLATGFYPRHISLTLFRDGQSVADHEVTGGNLLPNDDGTYQMRKILEISAEEQREKHTYTCTATHLSLDNKLDITLEYDHGKPLTSVISSVLTVLGLLLIFGTVAAVILWRKRHAASSKSEYSSASTSEQHVNTTS